MARRSRIMVGNNMVDVMETDFEIVREDWNEYKLLDGGTVRVKMVVQKIYRLLDDQGRPKFNQEGDPEIVVRSNNQIVATG